jgi:serine phosphatase RsbU (regulator of sigma subunit)
MESGDVLMLLTDGFFERQRSGDNQEFGIARVEEQIAASADSDSSAILRALDTAVHDFAAGTKQQDDMTAVVIKRTQDSQPQTASAMACTAI